MRLPDRLPERESALGSLDISGDPLIDLLSRPQQLPEIGEDIPVDTTRFIGEDTSGGLEFRDPDLQQGITDLLQATSPSMGTDDIEQTVRSALMMMDEIQGDQDYSGLSTAIGQMFPDSLSSRIQTQMEGYDTLTPEEQAMLTGREESIENRFRDRERRVNLLREMGERYEDPSSLETYLTGAAEMAPEFQRGDEIARSLAGVGEAIAGNIFPGDLGRGLSSLVTESADRMLENRIRDEDRRREIFTAEENRKRLHDEYRSTALEAELSSGVARDEARERLADLRLELSRRDEALLPSLYSAIQSEQERDISLLLELTQQGRMDRQAIFQMIASLMSVSASGRAGTSPMSWMGDIEQVQSMYDTIVERIQQGVPPPTDVESGDPGYVEKQIYDRDVQMLRMLADLLQMHRMLPSQQHSPSIEGFDASGILGIGTPPSQPR